MTNKTHFARCAPLAIAATLALGSTPLLAQDATAPAVVAPPPPTIVIPEPAASAPPAAPTIVIPDELTQPAEPAAAAPQQPARTAPRTAAPSAPAQTRTETRTAAPRAAPAPAADTSAGTPVTNAADAPLADTQPGDTAPAAIAAAPEPIAAPELSTPDADGVGDDNTMAIGLGILGALGLMGLGFVALRRKGPKRYAAAAPTIEKPVVRKQPERPLAELPEGTGAPEFPAEPALAQREASPAPTVAYAGAAFASKSAPASSLSHSGASVALPREAPESFEEREALLRRMVDAKPDRANPFVSTRARRKRARLILASLGREFKNRDPWIDLSQYPSNWPALSRRQSAAA